MFPTDDGAAHDLQRQQGGVRQLPDHQAQPQDHRLLHKPHGRRVSHNISSLCLKEDWNIGGVCCNITLLPRVFTIRFRSFSPMPNALEFHSGQSYYFISTSSPLNMTARAGGYCVSNNMKVSFMTSSSHDSHVLHPRLCSKWPIRMLPRGQVLG